MAAQLDHAVPLLQQGYGRNDCGPYAIAMAIGFFRPDECDAALIAREISFLRVPGIGATLPWAIGYAVRRHGLAADGGWFTPIQSLRGHLEQNRPVIVIVRPTDFAACPWYALHYRVAIGYRDDPALPGGGKFYFNCSATPLAPARPEPGNLTVEYLQFARQWRTYLTWNWAVAVCLP